MSETALELYEALRRHQSGTLDRNEFWNMIFETDGLASLPDAKPST